MFLIFSILLGILPIIFWTKINKKRDFEFSCIWAIAISGIIIFIHLITYTTSLGTIVEMEAFYTNNKTIYSQAVEKFPEAGKIIAKEDVTTMYFLAYEMTKEIVSYNKNLTWYHKYQSHWLFGGFVGKIPDNLEYISL
jgi:CDP-diglyceride synthetase